MTLENLLAIHKLQVIKPEKAAVAKLLASAARNLEDSGLSQLSVDNRFDAAYKTIMQCSMIGLLANGYRTSTSQPGHHQTAIQALPKTMGISPDTVMVLDALRRRRNLSDYEGDPIPNAILNSCMAEAAELLGHTREWLGHQHPDLV